MTETGATIPKSVMADRRIAGKIQEASLSTIRKIDEKKLNGAYSTYMAANMELFGLSENQSKHVNPDVLREMLVSTLNKRLLLLTLCKVDKEFKKNKDTRKEIGYELDLTNKSLLALNGDEQYTEQLRRVVAWSASYALENASKEIFPKQRHSFGKSWITSVFGPTNRHMLRIIKERIKHISNKKDGLNLKPPGRIDQTMGFSKYFNPQIETSFPNGDPKSETLISFETNLEMYEYEKWKNPKQDDNGERYVQAVYNAKNRLATIEQNIKSWIS